MKPREFWIKLAKYHPQRHVVCKTEPVYLGGYATQDFYEKIHVREVAPIDFEKVWIEYHEKMQTVLSEESKQTIVVAIGKALTGQI